ncbi:MAG TPA: hypothetical protein PLO89_01530 [Spirochaetota bacterium]|nr:hypothetical protein [Spirochaetota bacterium]
MNRIIFTNRRFGSRFSFDIEGKLTIIDKNFTIIEEKIKIINISLTGIEITFRNNDFFYHYLSGSEEEEITIKIKFDYEGEEFEFENKVLWIKVEDIGERNYIIYSGLDFVEEASSYLKEKRLDLLVGNAMQNIYIP